MMDTKEATLSAKLRYARERMGLTGAQIKAATGIGESSLSEFENGKREPSLSQLQSLARLYNRSISFFLDESPIPQELVLWREHPSENAAELENRFLRLCEQYHYLETWCSEPTTACLPTLSVNLTKFTYRDAGELAANVRSELGLGDRPSQALLRVLEEDCGVKVFHMGFDPTGSAAATKSDTFGWAVLLNSKNVRWRRNYDLAHELFHLLVWDSFRSANTQDQPSEEEEKLADFFAAGLLMPADPVRKAVNHRIRNEKLSYEAFYDLARQFDVSVESLIWRLYHLHIIDPGSVEDVKQMIEQAKALSPVLEDRERDTSQAPQLPERYRALALRALRHGDISIGRFAEYVGCTRRKAMEIAEQEDGEIEEIPVTPA